MRKTTKLCASLLLAVLTVTSVYAILQYTESVNQNMVLKSSYQIELRYRNGTRIMSYNWGEFISRSQKKFLNVTLYYSGTQPCQAYWDLTGFPSGWIFTIPQWAMGYRVATGPNQLWNIDLILQEDGAVCGTPYSFTLNLKTEN